MTVNSNYGGFTAENVARKTRESETRPLPDARDDTGMRVAGSRGHIKRAQPARQGRISYPYYTPNCGTDRPYIRETRSPDGGTMTCRREQTIGTGTLRRQVTQADWETGRRTVAGSLPSAKPATPRRMIRGIPQAAKPPGRNHYRRVNNGNRYRKVCGGKIRHQTMAASCVSWSAKPFAALDTLPSLSARGGLPAPKSHCPLAGLLSSNES